MTVGLSKQLYTVEDAATRLNLPVKTVRRFIRQGRRPAKRIGREYRITRAALDELSGMLRLPGIYAFQRDGGRTS